MSQGATPVQRPNVLSLPTEILLIRHAIPEPDGTADPALGDVGRAQSQVLAEWLGDLQIDAVYASTLTRAIQTAEPLAAARGLTVQIDGGLVEWVSATKVYQQVEKLADPARAAAWDEGRYDDFLPEHNADELRRDMCAAIRRIGLAHSGQTVAVVSHGGACNTFLAAVVDSPRRFFFSPGYTSISRVQVQPDRRFVLKSINETSHLR
jgi:probable phosphoglycerate mutase